MADPASFGKYVVTEPLGSGGMAEVYAGMHPDLERKVAIKVILPQFATESDFEERFRREARVVASLRHAHIVQIYDFDVVDGRHFMVMEYLDGGTLKESLRAARQQNAPMALPAIAVLLEAMAGALDYAHGRGAIHRDIKPANILFTAEGEAVLTDFGIAKLLEDAARLTATGGVVGSPFYMPPEQANGSAVEARSDQYSLGVVLYEMATGRPPFQGGSAVAVMTQHVNSAPPPPRGLNSALSPAVEAVLLKALAKAPEERFGSCGELAQAFRDALAGKSHISAPVPSAADPERTVLNDAAGAPAAPVDATVADTGADTGPDSEIDTANRATVVAGEANDHSASSNAPADAQWSDAPAETPPEQPASPAPVASPRADRRPDGDEQETGAPQLPAAADQAKNEIANAGENRPSDQPAAPARPENQSFNVGNIQAGIVNQGGEQNFGDLTFNLDFGEAKAAPQDAASNRAGASESGEAPELVAILEALHRAFAGSARVDRFVRLVTDFHTQLEALPAERAGDRQQVVKRVQALLTEMTEAEPDPDMVEIMGTSLERAVQPLSTDDPDLSTMVTRLTTWGESLVQSE